jgi:hypothetical protein
LDGLSELANLSSPLLTTFQNHDCLLDILEYLTFDDLNNFSLLSKECYNIRSHTSLDQTRSGIIRLNGSGVQTAAELMKKIRTEKWHTAFQGNRTHLRLLGLNRLSSDIDPIDADFLQKCCTPLEEVTSLDCSVESDFPTSRRKNGDHDNNNSSSSKTNSPRRSSWLSRYEDYVDKGFSHALALSHLFQNLRSIDMSETSLTSLGVALLAENNPDLECVRWNHSLIWPINHQNYNLLQACRNLKEIHIDDARLLFCPPRRTRRTPNNENADGVDVDAMWVSVAENATSLVRVSCKRASWYQNSKFKPFSQDALMKFVLSAPNLKWFRSDLTSENVSILKRERPEILFCRD